MTPEERARRVVAAFGLTGRAGLLEAGIADAIREAVAAERERCARVADTMAGRLSVTDGASYWAGMEHGAAAVAENIRGGMEPAPEPR